MNNFYWISINWWLNLKLYSIQKDFGFKYMERLNQWMNNWLCFAECDFVLLCWKNSISGYGILVKSEVINYKIKNSMRNES
jgi:hypothetical protein